MRKGAKISKSFLQWMTKNMTRLTKMEVIYNLIQSEEMLKGNGTGSWGGVWSPTLSGCKGGPESSRSLTTSSSPLAAASLNLSVLVTVGMATG